MTKARNAVLVPFGLILMAGVLLIVVLLRAQVAFAPAATIHQISWSAPAAAAPAAQANSNSAVVSQQTIKSIGSSAPLPAPQPATQQPAAESVPAPGSAHCPTQPGSGLPCTMP
jgi:hypothetical protein